MSDSPRLTRLEPSATTLHASDPLGVALAALVDSKDGAVEVVDDFTDCPIGRIDYRSMLGCVARLFPQVDDFAELTVSCAASHYCASAIARAVEDADAHLLNLNMTASDGNDARVTVMLRVSHSAGMSVARSLERYGYDVEAVNTPAGVDSGDLSSRVNELLHLLEV